MTDDDHRPPVDIRAQMRQQMLAGLGGWTGMLITAIPTVVFVIANAVGSLRTAVIAAIAAAIALTGYRLSRRQPIQQALNGLVGVLIAAVIAARTGQARGYFLLGIWSSFAYGGVFLISMLARRPLVGVIWEFLDPTPSDRELAARHADVTAREDGAAGTGPPAGVSGSDSVAAATDSVEPWHRRRFLANAYLLATAAATAVFAARGIVQLSLFQHNSTGWLAVARIAMGYPLTIAAFGFAWYVVRRARNRIRLAAG
jgi:hypothetical protein